MKTTLKCDACHQQKELLFFKTIDDGYVAYCKDDAIKFGYIKENPDEKDW